MVHLVKCFAEIQQYDVCLFAIWKVLMNSPLLKLHDIWSFPHLKLWVGVLLSRDVWTHGSAYSTRLSITWSQYLSQITSHPTPVRPVMAILWHSSKFTQGRTFINIPFFHWQPFSGMPSQNRASVKRTYGVYYALRLPPDIQIELQRRTADFRNIFCPSEIDTRDVQKLSKGPPTFNQLYDVCPAYLPEIHYLCWLSIKDVPLSACGSFIDSRVKRSGTLLMAAWSLRVFAMRAELINWCLYN